MKVGPPGVFAYLCCEQLTVYALKLFFDIMSVYTRCLKKPLFLFFE